ncbi:hypothetical protein [Microbacterium sp.]|jgi:hypothetical protein|uniref:hypothetical protein n=1 Tax=Microbacterium sp. TaxID=51671 RepID=UPI0035AE9AE4
MTSLLEQMRNGGTEPVPPFAVLLPPGWLSLEPTKEALRELADRASGVFRSQHRPDLDGRFRVLMDRAARELLQRDPVRIMLPGGDVPPEDLFPLSIIVARVTAPENGPLDAKVHELVRRHGAAPFDEDAQIMRWHSDGRLDLDGGVATVRSFNYLIAIPGTERHSALLFTGVLPVSAGERLDDDTIAGAQALMDAIMSTFRWSR